MNLLLIGLLNLFPVSTNNKITKTLPQSSVQIIYSSNGFLKTKLQKMVYTRNGLSVFWDLTNIKSLKTKGQYLSSGIGFSLEKTFTNGLSFSFKGYFDLPYKNNLIMGGIK